MSNIDILSDAQRIGYIKRLIDEGYASKIVLAQDIFGKHALTKYGGYGYAHILEHIVPRLYEKGLSEDEVELLMVKNPADILTFESSGT